MPQKTVNTFFCGKIRLIGVSLFFVGGGSAIASGVPTTGRKFAAASAYPDRFSGSLKNR